MPAHKKSVYSINEAAKLLGVVPVTLRLWEKNGIIDPQRTPGNQRRYTSEQIDLLLASTRKRKGVRKVSSAVVKSVFPQTIPQASPTPTEIEAVSPINVTAQLPRLYKSLAIPQKKVLWKVSKFVFASISIFALARTIPVSAMIERSSIARS